VSSSVLARGFTALHTFSAMWITDSMFTAAIGAWCRTAAIIQTHQGVSITSIISTEMRCEMDVAT
jgi:predicted N-acyltransferase